MKVVDPKTLEDFSDDDITKELERRQFSKITTFQVEAFFRKVRVMDSVGDVITIDSVKKLALIGLRQVNSNA